MLLILSMLIEKRDHQNSLCPMKGWRLDKTTTSTLEFSTGRTPKIENKTKIKRLLAKRVLVSNRV